MEFINFTPFPALAFQALDQNTEKYHVVVMRATLDIKDGGILQYSEDQSPLAVTDEYFGGMNKSSVKQESDLSPFKPTCDVIVNGTAYAPEAKPCPSFEAGIRIGGSSVENPDAEQTILEKRLRVTGPRCWKEEDDEWNLTEPEPISSLPLRYEYAYGGECRINLDDPAADQLDAEFLLTPEQREQHPDGPDQAPAAHTVCENNPIGMGFTEPWYLKATDIKIIPAPQIESPNDPVGEFGKHYVPQGFGIIGKGWLPRRTLCGTVDDNFIASDKPLPDDFDFAYWNCAHPEMQVPFLKGDETIELTNLTPGGELVLQLPGHLPYALVGYEDGAITQTGVKLDTLIIEPQKGRVSCVYRLFLPVEPKVLALEARLIFNGDQAKEGETDNAGEELPENSLREAHHG